MRVSELDGREYLRRAPSQLAENPFPQHSPPVRGKARNRGSSAARRGATSDKFSQWTRPTLNRISHIVMNLPDSAIEFLCELRGALSTTSLKLLYAGAMPMVHVHCFTRELDRASARKDIVTVWAYVAECDMFSPDRCTCSASSNNCNTSGQRMGSLKMSF